MLPGGVTSAQRITMAECSCDFVTEVPADRWNMLNTDERHTMGDVGQRIKYGGFVHGAEPFDNAFFRISRAEAAAMDPQQRLLLEQGYAALHAGKLEREGRDVGAGVFVAIIATEFGDILANSPEAESVFAFMSSGGAIAVASGRISFSLGLQGPCSTMNTACSASLVATHAASSALALNECSLGLSAAANLMLLPAITLTLGIGGFTSPNGRCFTFDRRGDGYARAEAIGALAIRSRTEMNGPELRGSAVRQDGRSASLSAPNGVAQQSLLRAVLSASAVAATEHVCIEAHGTGTQLGEWSSNICVPSTASHSPFRP